MLAETGRDNRGSGEKESGMVNINWTVIPQIINFIVIIVALNVVLYRPIRDILKKRQERINSLNSGIDGAAAQAQEKERALEAGIAKARNEGVREKEALTQAAEEEQKRIIGEINEKAQKDLEGLRASIAKEMVAAREELSKEVEAYAAMIGEKILGRAVS